MHLAWRTGKEKKDFFFLVEFSSKQSQCLSHKAAIKHIVVYSFGGGGCDSL